MSNLTLQISALADSQLGDAVIFQQRSLDSKPDYKATEGLIRRVDTDAGPHWSFCTLLPLDGIMFTGAVTVGAVDDIINLAEYQCGSKIDSNEWIVVKYTDPDFPHTLKPTVI